MMTNPSSSRSSFSQSPSNRTQPSTSATCPSQSHGCVRPKEHAKGAQSVQPLRPELFTPEGCYEFWAVLAPQVAEQLNQNGAIYCKLSYLDDKYGDAAWSFKTAYLWMGTQLAKHTPQPHEAESPYWLYRDLSWATPGPDSVALRLQVPAEELLLFDRASWNHVLQLDYVPKDSADQANFETRLARMGVTTTATLFTTAFYPLQKSEVINSWSRALNRAATCPESDLQAATWCIRSDWILEQKTL